MANVKSLNIKNMKETLINYSGNQEEMNKIWDSFYQMCCLDFISRDTWCKFFDQCKGWYVTEDNSEVRDSEHDDKVIWVYTPDAEYRA